MFKSIGAVFEIICKELTALSHVHSPPCLFVHISCLNLCHAEECRHNVGKILKNIAANIVICSTEMKDIHIWRQNTSVKRDGGDCDSWSVSLWTVSLSSCSEVIQLTNFKEKKNYKFWFRNYSFVHVKQKRYSKLIIELQRSLSVDFVTFGQSYSSLFSTRHESTNDLLI